MRYVLYFTHSKKKINIQAEPSTDQNVIKVPPVLCP